MTTSVLQAQSLDRSIAKSLHKELAARVSPGKFFVEVKTTEGKKADDKRNAVPLIPDYLDTPVGAGVSDARLGQLESLAVTLHVDRSIRKSEQAILKVIIEQNLRAAADKLTIEVKRRAFPKSAAETKAIAEKSALSKKILELESREKNLARERNDIKTELATSQAQLADALARANGQTADGFGAALKDLIYRSSIWMVIAVLALVAVFLSLAHHRAGMVQASSTLAGSFAQIAQALGELSNGGHGETIDVSPHAEALPAAGAPQLPAASTDGSRVLRLREELADSLQDVDEQYTLHYLNQLLKSADLAARGVYVMELMPREVARELFDKLGVVQKQTVSQFLMGEHPANKVELMIAAGEEFMTKLMKGHLGAIEEHLDQTLITKVELLNEELRLAVGTRLSVEAALRFLLYLRPEVISLLLESLKREDPKAYDRISIELIRLAEFETRQDLDEQITVAIEQIMEAEAKNTEKRYLPFFKKILSGLDDEHSESLMQIMGGKKKDLATMISESVITTASFFKIAASFQLECIDGLSNRELAALSAMFNPEQQTVLEDLLGERKLALLADEKERLAQRGKSEVERLGQAARKKLLKNLERLVAENGSVEAMAEDPSAGVEGAAA